VEPDTDDRIDPAQLSMPREISAWRQLGRRLDGMLDLDAIRWR